MNLGFVAAAFLDGTKPISYAAAREAAYKSCEHRDDGAMCTAYPLENSEAVPVGRKKLALVLLDKLR